MMPYEKGSPSIGRMEICFCERRQKKNTALSGEMVTFLLSQAISMLVRIIFHRPMLRFVFSLPSEINILQQQLRWKDTHTNFRLFRWNIIIFCHLHLNSS